MPGSVPRLTMNAKPESLDDNGGHGKSSGSEVGGLDAQLWHACAGGMVQLPRVGAKVVYFPQGHGEQAASTPDFPRSLGPSGSVPCRVVSLNYLADSETDEVFARICLQPEAGSSAQDLMDESAASPPPEKPPSFAKTLTQSDANNGGGFSVPRYCAETIFPPLDYSTDPPVQTVLAKDVHGDVWKFRHIYRGTPRRHLLTTGWSTFVNQKKLVAGDAIVFLRIASGELCVGVRRSMRGASSGESSSWHSSISGASAMRSSRWEVKGTESFADFLGGVGETNGYGLSSSALRPETQASPATTSFARDRARVTAKSVLEAATLAISGKSFEVVYYPRASTAEFCVKAGLVKRALEHSWYAGMRFKMAFETEDSSRISWFMGTIAAVQPADQLLWPSSPWRVLQVTWDEPDLLQGVSRVSPWQVELVATLPMQLPPFSLPMKKQRQSGCKLGEADTDPEEGEVIEEDNRGLLSQLVEEEVGLWTTDIGDEEIISSKIDSDEDGKKKVRAPISAERKLKKKVAFRRKRAEKEKELGIRRPRLPVNMFKPKVPLCKFYIKGRCTLGAKCTFSHDVVPVTKSDPCKFFMVNRCLKGDDCPFSHTLDTFPCKFWHTRGHCLDGSNCRFSHGPLTDDQRQNLAKRIEHDSKEQLNVPDIPTDFNNAPEDPESEYMPTVNSSQNEALGWDANPPQALNQDTACYASTSIASQILRNNREVPSAAPRASFVGNQSNVVLGEVNREEIQLTDIYKEDPTVENSVLLAARKAASAAAVQATGSTDKLLLSRSGSATSIAKSRSFGRGKEASAMDLLQASFGSDDRHDLSRNASSSSSSQAVSNTSTSSALALCRAGAGAGAAGGTMFPSSGPLSRAIPSSLAHGSSFGHTKHVVPGNKASAMELIKASLGNEATPDDNTRETDFPWL